LSLVNDETTRQEIINRKLKADLLFRGVDEAKAYVESLTGGDEKEALKRVIQQATHSRTDMKTQNVRGLPYHKPEIEMV
jgi:hypothetical protein